MSKVTGQLVSELQTIQLQNEQVIKLLDKVLQTSVIINNRIDSLQLFGKHFLEIIFISLMMYLIFMLFKNK